MTSPPISFVQKKKAYIKPALALQICLAVGIETKKRLSILMIIYLCIDPKFSKIYTHKPETLMCRTHQAYIVLNQGI